MQLKECAGRAGDRSFEGYIQLKCAINGDNRMKKDVILVWRTLPAVHKNGVRCVRKRWERYAKSVTTTASQCVSNVMAAFYCIWQCKEFSLCPMVTGRRSPGRRGGYQRGNYPALDGQHYSACGVIKSGQNWERKPITG